MKSGVLGCEDSLSTDKLPMGGFEWTYLGSMNNSYSTMMKAVTKETYLKKMLIILKRNTSNTLLMKPTLMR